MKNKWTKRYESKFNFNILRSVSEVLLAAADGFPDSLDLLGETFVGDGLEVNEFDFRTPGLSFIAENDENIVFCTVRLSLSVISLS